MMLRWMLVLVRQASEEFLRSFHRNSFNLSDPLFAISKLPWKDSVFVRGKMKLWQNVLYFKQPSSLQARKGSTWSRRNLYVLSTWSGQRRAEGDRTTNTSQVQGTWGVNITCRGDCVSFIDFLLVICRAKAVWNVGLSVEQDRASQCVPSFSRRRMGVITWGQQLTQQLSWHQFKYYDMSGRR